MEPKSEYQELLKKVKKYKLISHIIQEVSTLRDGVARSTVYKAFSDGPASPALELVIDVAKRKVAERESKLATTEAA